MVWTMMAPANKTWHFPGLIPHEHFPELPHSPQERDTLAQLSFQSSPTGISFARIDPCCHKENPIAQLLAIWHDEIHPKVNLSDITQAFGVR